MRCHLLNLPDFVTLQRVIIRNLVHKRGKKMELNDNKAGMEGLDKERINGVIKKATEGTNYHKHQMKRERQLAERIQQMQLRRAQLRPTQIAAAENEMDEEAVLLDAGRRLDRTIVHVDMDAFYAAVEMRDEPKLRDKPLAVGSISMLSTSNYIARRFGVRAAMPGFIGLKLCPDLVIVKTNFNKYTKISGQIREVMMGYDPNMQPMSLDEAYLDITDYLHKRKDNPQNVLCRRRYCGDCKCWLPNETIEPSSSLDFEHLDNCVRCGQKVVVCKDTVTFGNSAEDVTAELRFKIHQKTGLTASAGIASNSMLAKVCSDKNKPNGQYYLQPKLKDIQDFVNTLPVRKVSGIGSVSDALLKSLGVVTCGDLYTNRGIIQLLFSKLSSQCFLEISLGLGSTYISNARDRKSVSVERTFSQISDPEQLSNICQKLCGNLQEDMEEQNLKGRTVTLKLKTVDFEVRTRAKSVSNEMSTYDQIWKVASEILTKEINAEKPKKLNLRLMGVRMSNFVDPSDAANTRATTNSIDRFLVQTPTNSSFDTSDDDSSRLGFPVSEAGCENSIAGPSNSYTCPVCSKPVNAATEHDMGMHVEDCLSRKTVDQILKDETPPAKQMNMTDKTTAIKSNDKKKMKRKSMVSNTKDDCGKIKKIDTYFERKA